MAKSILVVGTRGDQERSQVSILGRERLRVLVTSNLGTTDQFGERVAPEDKINSRDLWDAIEVASRSQDLKPMRYV